MIIASSTSQVVASDVPGYYHVQVTDLTFDNVEAESPEQALMFAELLVTEKFEGINALIDCRTLELTSYLAELSASVPAAVVVGGAVVFGFTYTMGEPTAEVLILAGFLAARFSQLTGVLAREWWIRRSIYG